MMVFATHTHKLAYICTPHPEPPFNLALYHIPLGFPRAPALGDRNCYTLQNDKKIQQFRLKDLFVFKPKIFQSLNVY